MLLDHGAEVAPLLLLYVNKPCVVIGKNQVPWRECATGRLRADGVPMARRVSGGGTVFHDKGNLNYSFILPRDTYEQDEVFALVLRALKSLGIEAQLGANNGLFVGDRKCSGSAFCYRRQHVLHHGTLLVHTDLDALRRYCAPALPQIETRAIASKPASVLNLRDLRADLETGIVADAIIHAAGGKTSVRVLPAKYAAKVAEMRAWDFLWGHTPNFRFPISDFRFEVERGRIVACEVPEFIGQPFDCDALLACKVPETGSRAAALFQALEGLDF